MKRCPYCAEEIQDQAVVCRYCGRELEPGASRGPMRPSLQRVLRAAEITLGAGAVLLVAYLLAVRLELLPAAGVLARPGGPAAAGEAPPRPPHVVPLLQSRVIELSPGEHFDTLFTVLDPRPCVLRGRVVGVSGGSRDVEVLVLDEEGYNGWHNGTGHSPLYASGRATAATLEVPLPRPGEYGLVVSNAFSLFTGKVVEAEQVEVRCE